jgi:L-amino acid N-acyltransferase YncA
MVATIRLVVDADAPWIAELYAPLVESTAITFDTSAPDDSAIRERIANTLPA